MSANRDLEIGGHYNFDHCIDSDLGALTHDELIAMSEILISTLRAVDAGDVITRVFSTLQRFHIGACGLYRLYKDSQSMQLVYNVGNCKYIPESLIDPSPLLFALRQKKCVCTIKTDFDQLSLFHDEPVRVFSPVIVYGDVVGCIAVSCEQLRSKFMEVVLGQVSESLALLWKMNKFFEAMSSVEESAPPNEPNSQKTTGEVISLLTPREIEVVNQMSRGLSNKEIALGLCISMATVKRHIESIFQKMGVHSRSAAVAAWISHPDLVPSR